MILFENLQDGILYILFSMGSKGNDEFPLKIDLFFSLSLKKHKIKNH
jgi:hypothetical protein